MRDGRRSALTTTRQTVASVRPATTETDRRARSRSTPSPHQPARTQGDRTDPDSHNQAHRDRYLEALQDTKTALDRAAIVATTNVAETITHVNEKFCQISGYTEAELVGQDHRIINSGYHPPEFFRQLWATIARGKVWTGKVCNRAKSGKTYWVDTTIVPFLDDHGKPYQYMAIRFDVTDREATQDKLRRAERRYRDLFEEAPVMYVVTHSENGKSIVEDCNNVFLANLGYVRTEVVGHEMREFASPSSPVPIEPRGDVGGQDRQLLRKNGNVLATLQTTVPLYDPDGRVRGERAMYIDISQLRVAAQKIDSLQTQLNQSQKGEAIGRLASGIAHDFNNILTAILGYSESIVMESNPGDPLHEDALEIHRAGEKAAALTHQLLALSKRQALKMAVVDLNDVVGGVRQLLNRLLGDHINVETRLAPDVEAVTADRSQLEQILINLAVNARDAMPAGGRIAIITATADRDQTDMGQYIVPAGRYATLAVTDTGTGMDTATLAQIFEPFFTTKGPGEGSGLGLATVYGTVKQLGGFIEVTSALGCGTTFTISLPATDEPVSRPACTETRRAEPSRGETILLVEDDAAVRAYATQVLRRAGYDVLEAPTPEAALRIADRGDSIHGVLTDVIMPGMNGKQLVTRLQETRPDLTVLYMSGYSGTTYVDSSIVDPARERLIEKPFTRDTLLRTLRDVLDTTA